MTAFRKGSGGPRWATAKKLSEAMEKLGCSCSIEQANTGTLYVVIYPPLDAAGEQAEPKTVRISNHQSAYEQEDYNLDPNGITGRRHGEVVASLKDDFAGLLKSGGIQ